MLLVRCDEAKDVVRLRAGLFCFVPPLDNVINDGNWRLLIPSPQLATDI